MIVSQINNLAIDGLIGFNVSKTTILNLKSQNNQKTEKKLMNHLKNFIMVFMKKLKLIQQEQYKKPLRNNHINQLKFKVTIEHFKEAKVRLIEDKLDLLTKKEKIE